MKHITLVTAMAVSLFGLSSCTDTTTGGDTATKDTAATVAATSPEPATAPMDSAAKMKAWMDYMTPGDPHKMLAASAGKWKTETTMWMEPGAPPMNSTGEATNSMILGGRYQRSVHKSSMMGQPFEGEALTGYDNAKKLYVSTWVDNMGTGIMQMEGTWDEATKSTNMKGSAKDPITGKETGMREVFRVVDDTHREMEMYSTVDGKESKVMEMKMTKM
jgi:hypothetical protein